MAENKSENRQKESKLNLLYILLTLKNYSSPAHPMSIAELLGKVNNSFSLNGEPLTINTTTLTRLLEPLRANENFIFPDSDEEELYEDPHNLGFSLHCVIKQNDQWIPYDPDLHQKQQRFYYCKSTFTDAELKTLIDAVEVYNYFSPDNILTLIDKLLRLSPGSPLSKATYLPDRSLKDPQSMVLNNIEDFSRIIAEKKLVKVTNCRYGFNTKTNKLELIPCLGYPRIIRPVSMMWSNGYYYLLAMSGSAPKFTPTNFRMDRILFEEEIIPTPEQYAALEPPAELSPSAYRLNHPVMFGGKQEMITMLCRESEHKGILNAVMDTFGTLANCRLATKDEMEKYLGYGTTYLPKKEEKWIHVRVRATTGGVELFATQYCRYCRVISPERVVKNIKKNLEVGTQIYS